MDESGSTEVMPTVESPNPGMAPGSGALTAEDPVVPPARRRIARRWFAAAVIAVLLLAAGIGVALGMRGDEGAEDTVVVEAEETVVPDLRGMTLERAAQDAEAAGLVIGEFVTAVVDEAVTPAGTVLSQEPLPGSKVEPGTAISLVIAQAPIEPPADTSAGGTPSGNSGSTGAPTDPPPAPADVTIDDMARMTVKPKVIDPGVFLLQKQWTTVLEHAGTSEEWMSGAVTIGSGDKRIVLNADGPTGYLVAVHSWGAGDTDWKLQSIVVSQPGDLPYESILTAPAGVHTFRVRSQNTAALWTVQVQEKK